MRKQSGQTLIETLVAVFILTMGIGAALGLASYSLNATTSIRKQIIAMGLAREGIEAVKNMRDTNWLRGTLSNSCFNYQTSINDGSCYLDWLDTTSYPAIRSGYEIPASSSGEDLYLTMDLGPDQEKIWTLEKSTGSSNKYALVQDNTLQSGLYEATGNKVTNSSDPIAAYGRKVTISTDNFSPFDQNIGPRLKVRVEVWWSDRKCVPSDTPPSDPRCKVSLETYLTNWKDYQ